MLISRKKRVIVLRLKEPERVLSVIPKAKKFTFKGKEYVAVPHRRDEVKVLNNIGIEAPSPMLYYYDWPGRYKPFEAQKAAGENWFRNDYAPYRTALSRLMMKSLGNERGPDTAQAQPGGTSSASGLVKAPRVVRPAASAPIAQPNVAASSPYEPLKNEIMGRHAPGFNAAEWSPGYMPKSEKEQREQNQKDLLAIKMKEVERQAEGPKQNQAQAGAFASSAKKAEDKFAELTGGGFNRADPRYSAFYDVSKIPVVGGLLSMMTPSDLAQQNAAERAFLNAVMRRDSGATIPPAEMAEGAKLYFPRPGDDAKTLEFKKQNPKL